MNSTRRTIVTPLLVGIPLGFTLAVMVFQAHLIVSRILEPHLLKMFGLQQEDPTRLLCWVTTHPINHRTQAVHVKNTWGARCDKLIFMSSANDTDLGAVALQRGFDGRDWLFGKTKEALKFLWENHRDEADWFLKADDDTYVVVENLKFMLRGKRANEPVYYGAWSEHPHTKGGFAVGGSGYVLSKEALRRFTEEALPDSDKCSDRHDGPEDVQLAECLTNVGVNLGNTKDEHGRNRFLHLAFDDYLRAMTDANIENKHETHYTKAGGLSCCSNNVVSFHYVKPAQFYILEYLLYHVKVDQRHRDMISRLPSRNITSAVA